MFAVRDAIVRALPQRASLATFQPIVWRLLATGVVARTASQTEADLYDRGVDIVDLLTDLFTSLGLPFQHDPTAQTLRLFAPGAQVPGLTEAIGEPYARMATPISADLAAAMIALWLLYREGIERNQLNEDGERIVLLGELDACMVTQLQNPILQRLTERRELLTSLRQFRVIRLPDSGANLEADEALAIQRGILSLVFDAAASAALAEFPDAPTTEAAL